MACSCKTGRRTALQLIDKYSNNDETYTFDFAALEPLTWKEGDSSALVMTIDGVGLEDSRKLSYATLPQEKVVRFTTRIREKGSLFKEQLRKLKVGDFVDVTYPEGDFTLKRDGRPALLLSNGVGVATMRALVKAFDYDGKGIGKLTQINVDRGGAIYREEFEGLYKDNQQFTSVYTSHRDGFYEAVDEETRQLMFGTGQMPYFYIVGSDAFVGDVGQYLQASGFSQEDIVTDLQGCGCGTTKIKEVKVINKVAFGRSLPLNRLLKNA